MRIYMRIGLVLMVLIAAAIFASAVVPGDLNGDNIVSKDEQLKAEDLAMEGNITADHQESGPAGTPPGISDQVPEPEPEPEGAGRVHLSAT